MHAFGTPKLSKPPRTIAARAFHVAPLLAPCIAHSFLFANSIPICWRHLQTLLGVGIAHLIESRWRRALATGAAVRRKLAPAKNCATQLHGGTSAHVAGAGDLP